MKKNTKLVLIIFLSLPSVFYFTNSTMASSRLKVNCNLEGAEVFLDGKFKGECPVEFGVSPGKHKVVLRKNLDDGSYYYYEREMRVGEDAVQEMNAGLKRIYAEQYYWNEAEKAGMIDDYKEFLMRYPKGQFAEDAKTKIEELRKGIEKLLLRGEPIEVSENEAKKAFGLVGGKSRGDWRLPEYIQNDFEDLGEVVKDHATGLMWQKSGPDEYLTYKQAQKYVQELNRQKFAGYNDWRLPTVPELLSLLEPERQSNDLYINPIFGRGRRSFWSADRLPEVAGSAGFAWYVEFQHDLYYGIVHRHHLYLMRFVRCVRS